MFVDSKCKWSKQQHILLKKKNPLGSSYLVPYFKVWRKIKEIALFQYLYKIDYFGKNFSKAGVRPEKKITARVFLFSWVFLVGRFLVLFCLTPSVFPYLCVYYSHEFQNSHFSSFQQNFSSSQRKRQEHRFIAKV